MSERLVPELGRLLAAGVPVVLVQVAEAKGSTPREAGAAMLVTADRSFGTIGGGRLEWEGIAHARALLRDGGREARVELPLGPAVGQCCGGHVDLWLRRAAEAEQAELEMAEAAAEAALPTVLLFGAGHVGRSLAAALAPLPLRLRWIDGRANEFPAAPPAGIEVVVTDRPLTEIERAPAGSAAFVLTHSHSLDFTLCSAVRISADRIAAMAGPIGGSALRDKRPPVIAALAAAEVLLGLAGARHRSIAASTAQERAA